MKIPDWIKTVNLPYNTYDEIPESVIEAVNKQLDATKSEKPLITILVAAYNEEANILRCIFSLLQTTTKLPFEILVVNNNSTDRTQDILDRLRIRSVFQSIQGCGPARQLGQENARGEYILLADADCLYPASWVDEMMKVLQEPSVVCVYGRYSFLPEPGFPRWQLFVLERLKDVIASYRQLKRPYLNTYGISMGYIKSLGLKVGYVTTNIRGEDGRLAFDLMKYGKIKPVKSNSARPWTGPRTLAKDGSFTKALSNRVIKEIKRSLEMLKTEKAHDTKTSKNES